MVTRKVKLVGGLGILLEAALPRDRAIVDGAKETTF